MSITQAELRARVMAQRLVDDEGILLREAHDLIWRYGNDLTELRRQARRLQRSNEAARRALGII